MESTSIYYAYALWPQLKPQLFADKYVLLLEHTHAYTLHTYINTLPHTPTHTHTHKHMACLGTQL